MILPLRILLVLLATLVSRTALAQTHVLVPDSNGDRVALLDAMTGTVLDANFIVDDPTGAFYSFVAPREAIQVGDLIWVTDQFADSIFRFDLLGNYVDTIDGATASLDNLRGGCLASNGLIYVAMDGQQNGATLDTIVQFSPAGNRIGSFTAGPSPFDVLDFNGELLVADFTDNTIGRYDYSGNFLGLFYSPAGPGTINQMEQLNRTASGGVVAAGFDTPSGLYLFDALGNTAGFFAGNNARGVFQLGNGDFLATLDDLVIVDAVSGIATILDSSGTFQFASPLDLNAGATAEFCFGAGSSVPGCSLCPCNNTPSANAGGGCSNANGSSGRLFRFGVPSLSNDSLRFQVRGANPSTFGILSSGDNRLPNNAVNPCFGLGSGVSSVALDGLRCTGGGVLRHGTRSTDAQGQIGTTTPGWGLPDGPMGGLIAQGGFTAGQTRHYQVFYRENPALSCGTGQNTTQGISVVFLP
ncbi:MAG: hypothetical protein AAF368_01705 [Planctomycetota bacterium]